MIETKEVSVVKQQATKALAAAQQLVISSPDDMVKATDLLSKVKTVGKMLKTRKEAITKPLNESLKSVRDLFKPIEQNHEEAEGLIKRKMLDYNEEVDKAAKIAEAKIAKKVEAGSMKPETAAAKMDNIVQAPTAVQGEVGAIATRIVKKYRVIDETLIPREYMTPDMSKITEALKAGIVVPGAEVYEEKVIAAR